MPLPPTKRDSSRLESIAITPIRPSRASGTRAAEATSEAASGPSAPSEELARPLGGGHAAQGRSGLEDLGERRLESSSAEGPPRPSPPPRAGDRRPRERPLLPGAAIEYRESARRLALKSRSRASPAQCPSPTPRPRRRSISWVSPWSLACSRSLSRATPIRSAQPVLQAPALGAQHRYPASPPGRPCRRDVRDPESREKIAVPVEEVGTRAQETEDRLRVRRFVRRRCVRVALFLQLSFGPRRL